MKTKIILVGGFLGAGKTTLLMRAAGIVGQRGIRAGLITNDQAPELVDSSMLRHEGLMVKEVSGSCFCCNYTGFIEAAHALRRDEAAAVILAEPVGSCTDLSATIVQPLKAYAQEDFEVAPLSVLADPARLAKILDGDSAGLHDDAAYIYRKQLEEADTILITKSDAYPAATMEQLRERAAENFPEATVHVVSSVTGQGIDEWLDDALSRTDAGRRIAEVDYDRYANGEAVLGWLNGTVFLQGKEIDWNEFASELMTRLAERFGEKNSAVGHLKIIIEDCDRFVLGNMTGSGGEISFRGSMGPAAGVRLTINARVETSPELLDGEVRDALQEITRDKCATEVIAWRYLMPGRPQPTHRFTEII